MGRNSLKEVGLIHDLMNTTFQYWDGYYMHESCFKDVRRQMKKVLDKYEIT